MALPLQINANTKFYIGSRVAYKSSVALADFSGQTWTEIGPLINLGDVMTEIGAISQEVINTAATLYGKGIKSFPMFEATVLADKSNAGQIAAAVARADCAPYAFMVQRAVDCDISSVVTMTIAAPGVLTWTAHGLAAGAPVVLATTGALPTGLVAGTTYYIASTPAPAANTFSLAATIGGTAITTSGTQSGVHTATASPVGETEMFYGLMMGSGRPGGGATDNQTRTISVQPICPALPV